MNSSLVYEIWYEFLCGVQLRSMVKYSHRQQRVQGLKKGKAPPRIFLVILMCGDISLPLTHSFFHWLSSSEVPRQFLIKYIPARRAGQPAWETKRVMRLNRWEAGIHTRTEKCVACSCRMSGILVAVHSFQFLLRNKIPCEMQKSPSK